jgi:hypothetical protein
MDCNRPRRQIATYRLATLPLGSRPSGWLAPLLALAIGAVVPVAGCATDSGSRDDQTADSVISDSSCGDSGRADAVVRKEALVEFQQYGKSCQPYEMTSFPQNDRETLWHVCCGGMALNFIFFPSKCVAHRGSGPVACRNQ